MCNPRVGQGQKQASKGEKLLVGLRWPRQMFRSTSGNEASSRAFWGLEGSCSQGESFFWVEGWVGGTVAPARMLCFHIFMHANGQQICTPENKSAIRS